MATGLIFLRATVLLPLRVGRWPVLLAALLGPLSWNFLFILPRFTFHNGSVENVLLLSPTSASRYSRDNSPRASALKPGTERRREIRAVVRESLVVGGRTASRRLSRLNVNAALDSVPDTLASHPVEVTIPADLPPVRVDFALTEQVLANLLLNAALRTPPATPIFVTAGLDQGGKRVFF